jgi:hypothetical protein
MADLSETLMSRLEEAVRPIERTEPILTTTGTRAAVASLAMRTQALEEAVRELAAALQAIAESDRQESFRS